MPRRLSVAFLFLLAIWLVVVAVLFVWPSAESKPPAHADVVVVLSGGLDHRLDPALRLVRRGVAPVLAISSPSTDPPRYLKARRLCTGQEATPGFTVLCFQAVPYSTRGEARTVARLAREHGWHRIVVVSSTYHLTRAKMLFHRCTSAQLWMVGSSWPWSSLPREWAYETGKLFVQRFFESGC